MTIQTLLWISPKLSIYNVAIKNLEDEFEFTTDINAVDKDVLLNAPHKSS